MEGHKGWRFIREGGFMRRKSGGRREEGRVLGGKERSRLIGGRELGRKGHKGGRFYEKEVGMEEGERQGHGGEAHE